MIGMQEMLLQEADGKILLFPAWPKDWDVHFKLHATGPVSYTHLALQADRHVPVFHSSLKMADMCRHCLLYTSDALSESGSAYGGILAEQSYAR